MEATKTMLRALWGFNRQATEKLLQVLAQIPVAELHAAGSPSRTNLWRLVNHIYYTEQHFVRACRGEIYQRQLLPEVAALKESWLPLHEDALAFLDYTSLAALAETIVIELGGKQFQFARWELLLQAVTHSIQHRGELSILLSRLGYPLPNMDLIVYLADTHGYDWPWK